MHTEEQAREMWCPMVRYVECSGDTSSNRWDTNSNTTEKNPTQCQCIASLCMMWRWAQKPNPDWRAPNGFSVPAPDTRFDPPMYVPDETKGFCGLAGRP